MVEYAASRANHLLDRIVTMINSTSRKHHLHSVLCQRIKQTYWKIAVTLQNAGALVMIFRWRRGHGTCMCEQQTTA